MRQGLEILRWAFWSPETRNPRLWREHWRAPSPHPTKTGVIPDEAIPAAHRRRMSTLSKLAVQIGLEAAGDASPDFLVFCSQHGDLTRLREMLDDIATGVELSPTAFSQSVHNASAGLYTIIARSRAPVSSLASGGSTFASGWIEAEGYLSMHPESQVLLVNYDEPLPREYLPYRPQKQCAYALGLLLRAAGEHERAIVLQTSATGQNEPLPLAPLFMDWALTNEQSFQVTTDDQGWLWTRAIR